MGSGVENSARIFAVEEGLVRNRIFDPFSFPGRKFGAVALRSPQRPPGVKCTPAPHVLNSGALREISLIFIIRSLLIWIRAQVLVNTFVTTFVTFGHL